jgi:hypothetical protein
MALHFMYYIFVRVHQTLRMTPAMAAGVTKRFWEIGDVVDVLEAWEQSCADFEKAYQHFYDLIYTTDKGMRPCESAGK